MLQKQRKKCEKSQRVGVTVQDGVALCSFVARCTSVPGTNGFCFKTNAHAMQCQSVRKAAPAPQCDVTRACDNIVTSYDVIETSVTV